MTTKLLTRSVQLRATDTPTEDRTFTGLAVPYDHEIDYFDWFDGTEREAFERGAIAEADGCKVFWRHGEVIGLVTDHRDTDAGWEIDGKISDTSLGRDAYALLRDGAITQLSVGFEPLEHRITEDGVKVWTKVRAREVSLVPNPAYETATISAVRERNPNMDTSNIDAQVRSAVEQATAGTADELSEIRQSLSQLTTAQQPAVPSVPFNSYGEYVRAVSSGDEAALAFHRDAGDILARAFQGGTTADAINLPAWVGDTIKLVEERRKTINTFSTAALPAEGNTIEYGRLKTNTITVEKQAAEGDDLAFGKIAFDTANAQVATYGGYTELSRQQIERSTVSTLDTVFTAFAIAYAKATETAVRTVVNTHLANELDASTLTVPADPGTFDYLDLVVDAAELFDERGFNLDGLKVSKDVFKALVRLTDGSGDPIFSVYGHGTNRVGSLDLRQISGDLANVPVTILPGATAGTIAAYDHVALTTWESPGAPFQLQDENIVNLTKQYSVYGYLAAAVQFPGALVPVKRGA